MPDFEVVILDTDEVELVETEVQGPPGVAGIAVTAGEAIAYGQVIRSDVSGNVFLADYENDIGEILGVAILPGVVGSEILYIPTGLIHRVGAVAGQVFYVGKSGDMTIIPPDHGIFRIIALAHRNDQITVVGDHNIRRSTWP